MDQNEKMESLLFKLLNHVAQELFGNNDKGSDSDDSDYDENDLKSIEKRAKKLLAESKFKKSIVLWNKAIQMDKTNRLNYAMKAICLTQMKKYNKALKVFDQVIALDPTKGDGYFSKSKIFKLMGDDENALRSIRDAVKIEPESRLNLETLVRTLQESKDPDLMEIAAYKKKLRELGRKDKKKEEEEESDEDELEGEDEDEDEYEYEHEDEGKEEHKDESRDESGRPKRKHPYDFFDLPLDDDND